MLLQNIVCECPLLGFCFLPFHLSFVDFNIIVSFLTIIQESPIPAEGLSFLLIYLIYFYIFNALINGNLVITDRLCMALRTPVYLYLILIFSNHVCLHGGGSGMK